MQKKITDDIDAFADILPPHLGESLRSQNGLHDLLEVVLDLGRKPEARYPGHEVLLNGKEVSEQDIEYVVSHISPFGDDNRAGIERTLHRISAIRNRVGRIVGLTCRVGRAVFGTIRIIEDLVQSGKSILLLGRPGVGKTTMLREVARVLADDFKKRVVIVDTSNEIAGDGDIPHPAIGHARRMQVATPAMQHAVMIEAVENHMPEVIVIDEMGTELEAMAARTIAERGVQLVATAHGNTLENLIANPTLSDLIGGVQAVTLSDEEARRRRTQKTILERKAPPTFDVVVEIVDRERVVIHPNVAEAVDAILRGKQPASETRWLNEKGEIAREKAASAVVAKQPAAEPEAAPSPVTTGSLKRIYPFGVNRPRLEQAIREAQVAAEVAMDLGQADVLVTSRNYYRRKPQKIRDAEDMGLLVYVVKNNTLPQMKQSLYSIAALENENAVKQALDEVREAVARVKAGQGTVELRPQSAYIRRLQHLTAERSHLESRSLGQEPLRRVTVYRGNR
ncbi:MAG: AAA family ATPase [Chloroflexi bacterium]|nr:AAA family ATPase [Chloroflexota bacterium]